MPLDSDNFAFMPIPTKIDSLSDINIVSISCGDSHSMAIDSEGKLYAWGVIYFFINTLIKNLKTFKISNIYRKL